MSKRLFDPIKVMDRTEYSDVNWRFTGSSEFQIWIHCTGNGGGSARMKFVLGIDSSSIVDFFSKNRQHLNSQLKVENRYKLTAGCRHKNLLNLGSFVIGARLMISQFFQTLISSGFVTHERSGWNTSYGWTWLWLKPWLEREDYKCDLWGPRYGAKYYHNHVRTKYWVFVKDDTFVHDLR